MIGLLFLLAIVAAAGIAAAWVGANPGFVTMHWLDLQIETSVAVLILLAVVAAFSCVGIYHLLAKILFAPKRYYQKRSMSSYQRAMTEITYSVAALAASDMPSAAKHTRKTEKLLGITPLTLMLRAQISKSEGSDEKTRQLLEQLLEHPETEYLAAKSLADAAQKQERLPQALGLAQRAHRVNPKEAMGAWAVFDLLVSDGQFTEAAAHVAQARKSGAFSRSDANRAQGKITLRQAENAYQNYQKDSALMLARQAVKLLPGDVKAAELCASIYAETSQTAKAMQLIHAQWKIEPSNRLAELFLELVHGQKDAKREKLIHKLVESNRAAAENTTLLNA